jgi:centrosomal protein POC5
LQAKHELKRSEEHRKDLDELVLRLTKENEMTTSRLNEALVSLDEANRLKQGMQENLRRAFMRGVCALNFEAMSVIQGP